MGLKPIMPRERITALKELLNGLEVEGAFVQCGVGNGVGAARITEDFGGEVWLFDIYGEVPPITEKDGPKAAWRYPQIVEQGVWQKDHVVENVQNAFLPRTPHIIKGWFQDTLVITDTGPIAFLSIDADWYNSTKQVLGTMVPRVVPGGIVVIDDYGHWDGCRKAVDEFLGNRKSIALDWECVWWMQ